jgi:hypothetical protein
MFVRAVVSAHSALTMCGQEVGWGLGEGWGFDEGGGECLTVGVWTEVLQPGTQHQDQEKSGISRHRAFVCAGHFVNLGTRVSSIIVLPHCRRSLTRERQVWHTCVSSLRTVSSPSSACRCCTFWDRRGQQPRSLAGEAKARFGEPGRGGSGS